MLYALMAFFMWSLFPLYFILLDNVSALEMTAQRLIWAFVSLTIVFAVRRQWGWLRQLRLHPKVLLIFICSAAILSLNWGVTVWATHHGRLVEASLGYFITPLITILFGCFLLKETLRLSQKCAVALAIAGVLWITWRSGALPYVGLTLGLSFGCYGLIRKIAPLGGLEGQAVEILVSLPFGLITAFLMMHDGTSIFVSGGWSDRILLILLGPIATIPLILFAEGARRIPLSLLGILQYLTPTMQLLIGVFLLQESFNQDRLIGFILIWCALAVYSADGLWEMRKRSLLSNSVK
jgi:chloramphenicol-sensitive protein RarD